MPCILTWFVYSVHDGGSAIPAAYSICPSLYRTRFNRNRSSSYIRSTIAFASLVIILPLLVLSITNFSYSISYGVFPRSAASGCSCLKIYGCINEFCPELHWYICVNHNWSNSAVNVCIILSTLCIFCVWGDVSRVIPFSVNVFLNIWLSYSPVPLSRLKRCKLKDACLSRIFHISAEVFIFSMWLLSSSEQAPLRIVLALASFYFHFSQASEFWFISGSAGGGDYLVPRTTSRYRAESKWSIMQEDHRR